MNVIADTCTMIWAHTSPEELSDEAAAALMDRDTRVFVSAMSSVELSRLWEADRLGFKTHWRLWFNEAIAVSSWGVLDIDLETAQESCALPGKFHKDPADRFIVAASRLNDMPIITADRAILSYPHVKTIW